MPRKSGTADWLFFVESDLTLLRVAGERELAFEMACSRESGGGTAALRCSFARLLACSNPVMLCATMKATITPAQLLGELMEPLGRALTPASARAILAVRAGEVAQERIADLASQCNQGTLTPEEKAEYQLLVEVGDVMALLQTRARLYLSEHPA